MSADTWLPDMSTKERAFYEKCPKHVLFELLRKLTKDPNNTNKDGWIMAMHEEWQRLHDAKAIPIAPPKSILKPFNW